MTISEFRLGIAKSLRELTTIVGLFASRALIAVTLSASYLVGSGVNASVFTGLGSLSDTNFIASGISGDGSTVVGRREGPSQTVAVRWTESTGWVELSGFAPSTVLSEAIAASYNGGVIVGDHRSPAEAFHWTQGGGPIGLGNLPSGSLGSIAYGTSADGAVIVGESSSTAGLQAFRWTSATDMVGLGDLPEGTFQSEARAISADGSVIVGFGQSALGQEAFRWTAGDGMVGLGQFDSGPFVPSSLASAVSSDGSVIVGQSNFEGFAGGLQAFRWTAGTGLTGLGDLAGGDTYSTATGVSGDGQVVIGSSLSDSGNDAFLWNTLHGMRSIKSVLTLEYGANLEGWKLLYATGISDDGNRIAGFGINPQGQYESWLATFGAEQVPEPTFLAVSTVLGFLGAGLCVRPLRGSSP